MAPNPYIAIEGAIGVGKTTLARILAEAIQGELLLEVFEENPFLGDFYADRPRYAFQTQLFFLLSRYRQQHRVIAQTLEHHALVSDYLFAKDWLFAHLNLAGDELAMYERVHAILGEQIPAATLVVYLKASTDTLMGRIAFRDRSYERQIERGYLVDLQLAYERFFAEYTAAPVLTIDTDGLDIVHEPAARAAVISRVKDALQSDSYQLPLPDMQATLAEPRPLQRGQRLPDFQRFQHAFDRERGFIIDLFFDYICLTEELGEIGRVLKRVWHRQDALLAQVGNRSEARDRALQTVSADLEEELADALAYLLKIANDAGIDLESAYIKKMDRNARRTWPSP
ncbi:MAG: Deoxyguanosine kinase [Chloroflexi bacterium ADurb.Bin325]|nr:MAG: Deoxyguanosine kinase [Chloroflexi bacterium ADurb.Bin325]